MSTSLLYHNFDIVGYNYVRIEYRVGDAIFTVSRKKFHYVAQRCESKKVIQHGSLPRCLHCLSIGRKSSFIKTEIPRLECKECHVIYQSDIKCLSVNKIYFPHNFCYAGSHNQPLSRRQYGKNQVVGSIRFVLGKS